jgi:transposase-like protein
MKFVTSKIAQYAAVMFCKDMRNPNCEQQNRRSTGSRVVEARPTNKLIHHHRNQFLTPNASHVPPRKRKFQVVSFRNLHFRHIPNVYPKIRIDIRETSYIQVSLFNYMIRKSMIHTISPLPHVLGRMTQIQRHI